MRAQQKGVGKLVDIKNREDLEIWLSERPVAFVYADCVSLSSRIALRILPRVSAAFIGDAERFRNLIVLPVFRAVQLSCALATEPTNTVNLREVIKRARSSIDLGERTAASFDAYADVNELVSATFAAGAALRAASQHDNADSSRKALFSTIDAIDHGAMTSVYASIKSDIDFFERKPFIFGNCQQ